MRFPAYSKIGTLLLHIALVALIGAFAASVVFRTPVTGVAGASANDEGFYQQTNLVSDIKGMAKFTDPNLKNSWGLSHSPTGPWWVADNATGVATVYNGDGTPFPSANSPLVVTIPPPAGSPAGTIAAPTGNIFNPVNETNQDDFVIHGNGKSGPSVYLFSTEDGTISGWNPNVDATHAFIRVDRSQVSENGFTGAVYKGLAHGSSNGRDFIYATNFRFGVVEMFDANFNLVRSFTDPELATDCPIAGPPAQCFAPFGIQNINGNLFVTFALQNAQHHDDVSGPGNGFVDIFDTEGHLIRRLASHGTLNSPWGLALAPNNFGQFSNDLLVGNFGDGRINAFNPASGNFEGQLKDQSGNPITIDDLWGLAFGNGGLAGRTDELFFAAGINNEADGLFGKIEHQGGDPHH